MGKGNLYPRIPVPLVLYERMLHSVKLGIRAFRPVYRHCFLAEMRAHYADVIQLAAPTQHCINNVQSR